MQIADQKMSFFSKIFQNNHLDDLGEHIENAKEKQLVFIKEHLKPLLKEYHYKTSGNLWWKNTEPFFNLIQLQNFSWNSKGSVDFTFNFTTGFTNDIKTANKPTIYDGMTYHREQSFGIPATDYGRDQNGYHIGQTTDMEKFREQTLAHFRLLILPKLNQLTSREAIEEFHTDNFWDPRVRQSLELGFKNLQIP